MYVRVYLRRAESYSQAVAAATRLFGHAQMPRGKSVPLERRQPPLPYVRVVSLGGRRQVLAQAQWERPGVHGIAQVDFSLGVDLGNVPSPGPAQPAFLTAVAKLPPLSLFMGERAETAEREFGRLCNLLSDGERPVMACFLAHLRAIALNLEGADALFAARAEARAAASDKVGAHGESDEHPCESMGREPQPGAGGEKPYQNRDDGGGGSDDDDDDDNDDDGGRFVCEDNIRLRPGTDHLELAAALQPPPPRAGVALRYLDSPFTHCIW